MMTGFMLVDIRGESGGVVESFRDGVDDVTATVDGFEDAMVSFGEESVDEMGVMMYLIISLLLPCHSLIRLR